MSSDSEGAQAEAWRRFVEEARAADDTARPFEAHWKRFTEIFADRDPAAGPPPAWTPEPTAAAGSNLGRLMRERGLAGAGATEGFRALHRWSVDERAAFWEDAVRRLGIVFARPPERTLDDSGGPLHPRWFPGARMNIAESCFSGPGDRPAIVQAGEGGGEPVTITRAELRRQAERFARALRAAGLAEGDAVALFMPMTVECVVAYLGTVLAGCAVVSIADSFSAAELSRRLAIGKARAIVTQDRTVRGGKTHEPYARVLEAARSADPGKVRAIVVPFAGAAGAGSSTSSGVAREASRAGCTGLRPGDVSWPDFLAAGDRPDAAPGTAPFAPCTGDPYRVTNVLFSSGTTGEPKAIPWTHLTPVKCAMDGHFHQDIRPGDVVAWPTNIGWMMGPWLIYAALVNGATIALYDGAPTGAGFARLVEQAGVTVLGVVPSLVRAWRGLDPWPADWSRVRVFSSTGEPSNREDYLWLMSRAGYRAPVIEYCGGTEIGGGYICGTVVQPASPSTFTTPALGLDLVVLDDDGRPVAEGDSGEVFLVPPSVGLSQTLLNRDHDEVYHAGVPPAPPGLAGVAGQTGLPGRKDRPLRRHGDRLRRLARGFFEAEGRADDTMNLGGIKVGSLELERVINEHPAVRESAAVAVRPPGGGPEKLVVFAVLSSSRVDAAALKSDLQGRISDGLNPLFRIHDVVVQESLPYTASNKLMRRELRGRYGA